MSNPITSLSAEIYIGEDLTIERCPSLLSLGGRKTFPGSVSLRSCPALRVLPDELEISSGYLVIEDCVNLESLPKKLNVATELGQAARIRVRPSVLLNNCPKITQLPETLKVVGAIDIAGTSITSATRAQAQWNTFAWRGFRLPGQALFAPETMDPYEIIRERNAEIRRLLIERFGIDKLFEGLKHHVRDTDDDPGGERRLIMVRQVRAGRADMQFLDCRCPSTGHRFLLEVPPTMRTCHEAAAWLAGFERPEDYRPQLET